MHHTLEMPDLRPLLIGRQMSPDPALAGHVACLTNHVQIISHYVRSDNAHWEPAASTVIRGLLIGRLLAT